MEAVQKPRRSVVKRQKREEARNTGSAVTAKLKDVPSSPRKMRLVADLIRGERVNRALSILKYQPKVGAKKLEKLLLSAIANWQNANEDQRIEDSDLYVKEIFVDSGRMLKRLRPAPQGRANRIRKRSNHVTITLDSLNASPSANADKSAETEVVESKAAVAEKKEKKKTSTTKEKASSTKGKAKE